MEKEKLVELVGKAQSGDRNALAELFYNFKDSVYFVAGKMLGSIEAAESVVSETTEIVLRKIGELDVADGFFVWVRMIADSVIVSKLGSRFATAITQPVFQGASVGDATLVTKERFDIPEVHSLVVSCVDALPEDLKLCAYMFYYQRLAVENIAKVLGMDKASATARMYAALTGIEREAAAHPISIGVLSAAPAWLISGSLHEQSARFTIGRERAFELLNASAKTAYSPKPSASPSTGAVSDTERGEDRHAMDADAVISHEASYESDDDDYDDKRRHPKKAVKLLSKSKHRDEADEDEDDDYDDEDYDDEDDDDERDHRGFFSSIWGKILIAFLALAIIGAAAAIFLPKILGGKPVDDSQTPIGSVSDNTTQPPADENQPTPNSVIKTADLAATYYGYYTDSEGKSGKIEGTMSLNGDGTWNSAEAKGTFLYEEATMKLTLTTDDGTTTDWNCWMDGANLALSQKVASTDTASTVYNYYKSEKLRDEALAAVDTAV
ncbi:MAG: sigma-70 family RNA polymerase sigma factor [Oscillospiraceae bacterium]